MSEVSAKLVQELRQKTGAGMMDCKVALRESKGNLEEAIEYLRKKGLKDLGKRSGKVAAEGTIGIYLHHGNQIAALVELNCETDFVARGDDFQKAARDLAMHVAAANPLYLSEEQVPASVLEREKSNIKKYFSDVCFLSQNYVRDESGKLTVKEVLDQLSVKSGEKVVVRRFQRFEVGEGVEKKGQNFAADVASIIEGN